MKKEEKIKAEHEELNKLIRNGMFFTVERRVYRRQPGFRGYLRKRELIVTQEKLVVQEPTLAILDEVAAEQIELEIDEEKLSKTDWMNIVNKMKYDHSRRLARIVALHVLGEDYFICTQRGSAVEYTKDKKRLKELTDLIQHGTKPSYLSQLAEMVSTISNMGDFTNSIRLMSASRTTMPILVEQKG
jgi:hypothetical protein